ncbi:hypothetical protein HOLleu_08138 [Holothuria leucospilota]|uniref:Distal membrane-arm assembly complex protein 1-like domain-containing protein n=1 Tax=Holothuria leucospilota TaxID=206669 RepID=A0A9Q1CI74_HOLLE|nr:hypothetical protein HOLleu_08138 [Holothuria leucospilota]
MGSEQPGSWIQNQKEKVKEDVTDFRLKDCAGCRLIGGIGIILAGGYVGFVGQKRAKLRGGGIISQIPSAIGAGVMISLGIMRLLGINPFTSSDSEIGIDALQKLRRGNEDVTSESTPP